MKNRTDLIKQLKQHIDKSCFRGKILWAIKDNKIIAYEIYKNDSWEYKTYTEGHIPFYSCPKNYLDITPCVDIEWRNKVREYYDSDQKTKDHIRKLFSKINNKCLDCQCEFKLTGHENEKKCPKCKSSKVKPEKVIILDLKSNRKGYYLNVNKLIVTQTYPFIHGRNLDTYNLYKVQTKYIQNIEEKNYDL